MAEYKTSPTAELLGGMVGALWSAFPESFQGLIKKILLKHGVADVNPAEWYALQPILDALKEIEETFGHQLLWQVGDQAASRAPIPPEIDTLKKCLFSLNATIAKFHRGGGFGGYDVQEENDKGLTRYIVTASTPYPCSLTRGYLEGYAKRFGKRGSGDILVRHDDQHACRRSGADTCTYIVTEW